VLRAVLVVRVVEQVVALAELSELNWLCREDRGFFPISHSASGLMVAISAGSIARSFVERVLHIISIHSAASSFALDLVLQKHIEMILCSPKTCKSHERR
jgi:hypothetical protein